ncbi:MAG: hypothetical protein QSU88_08915, partial [Candidatus Methanoperedens sp.]|nr:hypothetical protein [Candidatus Methanoperedens sp.]
MKKHRISFILTFLILMLILASGCIQQETQSRKQNNEEIAGRVISERLIVKFGFFSGIPENFKVSPDSTQFVYVEKEGEKQFAVLNGEKEKKYDDISGFIFSPDSKRLAYAAKENDRWFLVVDGKEETHYENVKDLIFSPDGTRMAYVANDSGKWFAIIDGNEENR